MFGFEGAFQLPGPEDRAREEIDRLLLAVGWVLQDKDQLNLGAGCGVAVRNFSLPSGPCDYLLFVDRKVAGVIEAKAVGTTLTGVSEQSERYMRELPTHLGRWANDRLIFGYESTGVETQFRDLRDPNSRSRNVFTFHRPEALLATLKAGSSFRGRLAHPAPLVAQGLRDCQIEALTGLDASLAHGDPKALIQMIMGAGKTFTACTASYRFIKHTAAKRVLFLVDRNNLGRQTLREFQDYCPPDDGRKFTQLYNVQHLQSSRIDPDAKVVITTIQRLYAMLRDQELSVEDEDGSAFEGGAPAGDARIVTFNPKFPIDTFDVIIIDECHRSIYGVWRQVLEYFDAHIIGLTATPSRHTLGYFNRNLVSEYPYERSVADGVNVGYEVFRIRTHVTEQGATVDAGYHIPVRDRRTRRVTYEQLDQDLPYRGVELDRSVTNPNQIRTVFEAYRHHLFTDLFPGRTEVPKTLVFAKSDDHADELVKQAREVFGKGNDFAKKVTYKTDDPEQMIKKFRVDYNPRIVVTVDMIATGTDLKPVEVVMFMRDVRSESYFEQMKGRGVRTIPDTDLLGVTPDAERKTRFVLVDAVGVTESCKTTSAPLERKRSVSFDKLMDGIAQGDRSEDSISSLGARLAALDRTIDDKDRQRITAAAGGLTLSGLSRRLVDAVDPDVIDAAARAQHGQLVSDEQFAQVAEDLKEQAARLFDDPNLRNTLKEIKRKSSIVIDETNPDHVIEAGYALTNARVRVTSFRDFIEQNQDHLLALQILLNRPYGQQRLTYKALQDLTDALAARPWHLMPADLWLAYTRLEAEKVRGKPADKTLTELIQLVRFAVSSSADKTLQPFAAAAEQRFNLWMGRQQKAGKTFTAEQEAWLRLIKDHIAVNAEVTASDLQDIPDFAAKGGIVAARRVFGPDINTLLDDLAGALVA